MELTEAQLIAIASDAPDILAVAGPGSGKTEILASRIKRLIADGLDPSRIIAMTFTNAAARELAERITGKAAPNGDESIPPVNAPIQLGFIGTIHAFCLRMLKEFGGSFGYGDRVSLISPESALDLLESTAKTLGCKTPIKDLIALKALGRPVRSKTLDLPSVVIATYLDGMRAAGIVDYDALLHEFRAILDSATNDKSERDGGRLAVATKLAERFTHLFVDEVQDSAPIDWDIFRALPVTHRFLVGDSDQAIYSFRGGRVRLMINHERKKTTTVIRLEENFRSRDEICVAAQQLIERNEDRIKKATRSTRGEGGLVCRYAPDANEGAEIARVADLIRNFRAEAVKTDPYPRSIAILARTNAIADGFRKTLPALGIEIVEQTRSDLPRDWRVARAFIELLVDPDNDALAFFYLIALYELKGATPKDARAAAHAVRNAAGSVGKSINKSNLGFAAVAVAENALKALATQPVSRESRAIAAQKYQELPNGATMLDFALALAEVREYITEGVGWGVRVLTIHGAKGREFDSVFVVGFEDEAIPGRAAHFDGGQIEEERRLAYVAITRARFDLVITSAASRLSKWGGVQARTESRFVREIFANDDVPY